MGIVKSAKTITTAAKSSKSIQITKKVLNATEDCKNSHRLIHLTSHNAKTIIEKTGRLKGRSGIWAYKGQLPTTGKQAAWWHTGLYHPQTYIVIPEKIAQGFKSMKPIGLLSGFKYFAKHRYLPAGILNLKTGQFIKMGINYEALGCYAVDIAVHCGIIINIKLRLSNNSDE